MKWYRNTHLIVAASAFILIGLIIAMSLTALAASNTVPLTRLGQVARAKLINDFRPAGCAGMTLVNFVFCTGTKLCNGTNQADLILGDSANNNISGKNGGDCIIAGGGDDTVNGANGSDVCIEGPGNDNYSSCTVVNP